MNRPPYRSSKRPSSRESESRFGTSRDRSQRRSLGNSFGSVSRNPSSGDGGPMNMNTGTIAVLAGVLVLGVGIGSAITSTSQGGSGNIASQQQLDMAVPDPEFCRQWGASAFVIDIEMYTTLNPSTSFVTQPALQPGCVIRREN